MRPAFVRPWRTSVGKNEVGDWAKSAAQTATQSQGKKERNMGKKVWKVNFAFGCRAAQILHTVALSFLKTVQMGRLGV